MSRNPKDLSPKAYAAYLKFDEKMSEAGIDYILTCTLRTQAEQDALWAKGRTVPGSKVTWTRKSKHSTGKAFDICIMQHGKCMWNPSLDMDKDGVPEYTEAGIIGESVGLKWGGRFKNSRGNPRPDSVHFEIS